MEDQELTERPQLMAALWEAVDKLDNDGQAQLMHFITGSSRTPIPGTELLRLEMAYVASEAKEPTQVLHRLPQAHSCENMLEVPNYWAAPSACALPRPPLISPESRIPSECTDGNRTCFSGKLRLIGAVAQTRRPTHRVLLRHRLRQPLLTAPGSLPARHTCSLFTSPSPPLGCFLVVSLPEHPVYQGAPFSHQLRSQ